MNDIVKQESVAEPQGQPQQPQKEAYVPPTIEVIEVKTEVGYAGSNRGNNFGHGGRW